MQPVWVYLFVLIVVVSLVEGKGFDKTHYRHRTNESNVDGPIKEGLIEVFMIPHTHDDVGWLITVDQYYIQQVQFILDSCIENLLLNPERKFTYVEQAYFERWWHEISEEQKQNVRLLYNRGQLEFNLGGITMNDEAVTTWYEEINQMTQGASFLAREIGAIPKSAWHIDPFGHSAATAMLWSQVGFPGFVLNRIPEWLKLQKRASQELEFIWRPSKSLGNQSDILIHVLDTWYSSPGSCAFNDNDGWNGIWVQDDPRLFGVNVKKIADDFAATVRKRSAWYRHNKLLIPFGDDFAHYEAFNSFVNMDKLISYMNSHVQDYNITVKYSFLSEYFQAIKGLNINWSIYEKDFFPYNDDPVSFWTGYYTSRPHVKETVRRADGLLQTAETLYTITKALNPKNSFNSSFALSTFNEIDVMRQATSVATHHDAVTGTEKQAVAEDYLERLYLGNQALYQVLPQLFQVNLQSQYTKAASNLLTVAIWNSLGWEREEFASVVVNYSSAVVTDLSTNQVVSSEVIPIPPYSLDFLNGTHRVWFLVTLPPLSFSTYQISLSNAGASLSSQNYYENVDAIPSFQNGYLKLDFDQSSNRIVSLTNLQSSQKISLSQNYVQYIPASSHEGQASGAYIFRAASDSVVDVGSQSSCSGNCDGTKTATAPFALGSLPAIPIILAHPTGQDYNDTFVTSIRSVSTTQTVFNVRRVDAAFNSQTWDQDLQVDYIPFIPNSLPSEFSQSQVGNVFIGISQVTSKVVPLTFPQPFSNIPLVFATAQGGMPYDDTFVIRTTDVTKTGCNLFVYRVQDTNDGWGQNITANWVAYVSSTSSERITSGSIKIGSNLNSNFTLINIRYPTPFAGNPVVLASVRANDGRIYFPPFATTNSYVDQYMIQINLKSLNKSTNWIDSTNTLYLDYLCYVRPALQQDVLPEKNILPSNVYTGKFVSEVQQFYQAGYGQTIRMFSNAGSEYQMRRIEIVNEIGPLQQGRELVSRFSTSLDTKREISTDDNGLVFLTREFNSTQSDLVSGNYYPMVSRSLIADQTANLQLSVLGDVSHGAASLKNGEVEVMLHRRCISDDGRGVGEVLNTTSRIQPQLWLLLDNQTNSAALHRHISVTQQFPFNVIPLPSSSVSRPSKNPAINALPFNVHLLSLSTVNNTGSGAFTTILRLQHIFAIDEHPVWSKPATIDLSQLFLSPLNLTTVVEMNLTGNTFKSTGGKGSKELKAVPVIVINPMEIRTFIITLVTK